MYCGEEPIKTMSVSKNFDLVDCHGNRIVVDRDRLDFGAVASPNRETEGMQDGSDAVSDWPLLNAL